MSAECHVCGDTADALYRHGETGGVTVEPFLVCGECGGGPVCGDCTDSLSEWAEWAAAVDDLPDPADRVPCVQCGNGG
jgi:hypothetical protein